MRPGGESTSATIEFGEEFKFQRAFKVQRERSYSLDQVLNRKYSRVVFKIDLSDLFSKEIL